MPGIPLPSISGTDEHGNKIALAAAKGRQFCRPAETCFARVSSLACLCRHATLAALCAVQSLALTLFPLHFFFHFLFYTDVGSLTVTLAAYLVSSTAEDVAAWLWDSRR